MEDTKYCRHCQKDKNILCFESRRDLKNGRSGKCIECAKNKIHVYKTPAKQLVRNRKKKKFIPEVVVYFEHDPYYKL